jgi:hypothetical protein
MGRTGAPPRGSARKPRRPCGELDLSGALNRPVGFTVVCEGVEVPPEECTRPLAQRKRSLQGAVAAAAT